MPTYFLDTSALVKRHIGEPGHKWVESLCDLSANNTIVISEAAIVEVGASFARMVREHPRRLRPATRDRLITLFDRLINSEYVVVSVNRAIFTRAAAVCRTHPLRAYDAVQLACALTRRDDDLAATARANLRLRRYGLAQRRRCCGPVSGESRHASMIGSSRGSSRD